MIKNKKGFLKKDALEKLGTFSVDIQEFIAKLPKSLSLENILNRCYNEMPQQFNEFLCWLKGEEIPYDDYLEGILQKE